jgi:predicted SnoaL-like aldol condensation-catalyzing enzyme
MNANHNKHIVRRYFEEVLLDGRRHLVDELFAPEICELVKRYAFFEAGSFEVRAVIAEGDTVMVHWHKSPLSGERPGQNGFAVFHLADEKIIGLEMIDFNGILRQIGAEVLS